MDSKEIRQELTKGMDRIKTLTDEARVQIHLASMDAKKEWDEKLAPRILEVEVAAKEAGETSRVAVHELVDRLEHFVTGLKKSGGPAAPKN